ncbi:hypothetical protein C6503_19210 [Candidatus Poribacteria bacterium]|nr:MAG: hypothetical protein C6503_19210 [Candidatus Poribacteria bacterium]
MSRYPSFTKIISSPQQPIVHPAPGEDSEAWVPRQSVVPPTSENIILFALDGTLIALDGTLFGIQEEISDQ